jgi:hypothetical protein
MQEVTVPHIYHRVEKVEETFPFSVQAAGFLLPQRIDPGKYLPGYLPYFGTVLLGD